jgi:ketosteroid isomerase-like protein
MTSLSASDAAAFAQRWLPAWTGNDPQRLAAFYSDDALYVDPGIPAGVHGQVELLAEIARDRASRSQAEA